MRGTQHSTCEIGNERETAKNIESDEMKLRWRRKTSVTKFKKKQKYARQTLMIFIALWDAAKYIVNG